jgi:uncharacterized protein YndB with AHSA1/START domain
MTTTMQPRTSTTQVYQVYIRATPQAIWDAITTAEWTARYGYGGLVRYDLRHGGKFETRPSQAMIEGGKAMGYTTPDIIIDGEVVEADPPRKLVQTWRMLMDAGMAAEGFTRLTYEITAGPPGVSKLTVVHELENAPALAHMVAGGMEDTGAGGGWSWILSDLKTLLETGERMG